MSALTTIVAALKGAPGVASLVGTRVFPLAVESGIVAPYLVVELLSMTALNGLRGSEGLDSNQVLVSAYAATYDGAHALMVAARVALEAAGALLEGEADQDFDEMLRRYRVTQQWFIWTT